MSERKKGSSLVATTQSTDLFGYSNVLLGIFAWPGYKATLSCCHISVFQLWQMGNEDWACWHGVANMSQSENVVDICTSLPLWIYSISLSTWTVLMKAMNQNHHHGDRARQSPINPLHCDNKLASFPTLEWPGNEANNNPPISKHVCQLLLKFLDDNLPATAWQFSHPAQD